MSNQSVTRSPAAAAFVALADPTRRALLDLLRHGGQPAGRMAQSFPVSRPAISRHLRVLLAANLVEQSRQGRHRVYRLNAEPLQAVDEWLQPYRAFWHTKLTHLKAFVESAALKERPIALRHRHRGKNGQRRKS